MVERAQNSKDAQDLRREVADWFAVDDGTWGLLGKTAPVIVCHMLTHPDETIRRVAREHLEQWTAEVISVESIVELAKEGQGTELVFLDKLIKSKC